jgi:hypothetical protein
MLKLSGDSSNCSAKIAVFWVAAMAKVTETASSPDTSVNFY